MAQTKLKREIPDSVKDARRTLVVRFRTNQVRKDVLDNHSNHHNLTNRQFMEMLIDLLAQDKLVIPTKLSDAWRSFDEQQTSKLKSIMCSKFGE